MKLKSKWIKQLDYSGSTLVSDCSLKNEQQQNIQIKVDNIYFFIDNDMCIHSLSTLINTAAR